MSRDWLSDINYMHDYYGFHEAVDNLNPEMMKKYLEFRVKFLQEGLDELKDAKTTDDVVDALIDLCVVAVGTLDLFGVDAELSWNEVFRANMNKRVGVKANRPNPLGLPDLMKPEGWKDPDHSDHYHGHLESFLPREKLYEDDEIDN